jgi:hypothetical protein
MCHTCVACAAFDTAIWVDLAAQVPKRLKKTFMILRDHLKYSLAVPIAAAYDKVFHFHAALAEQTPICCCPYCKVYESGFQAEQ